MPLSSLNGNLIAYDTETTGLNPWGSYERYGYYPARPFAFAFCDENENTAYVRWEVDPKTRQVIPDPKTKKQMSEILNNPNIVKIGHNLNFDIRMSRKSDILFNWNKIHDTLFMAHLVTGGSLLEYGLKPLMKLWLDVDSSDQEDLINSVKVNRKIASKKGWKIATKETHGDECIKSDYWLADRLLCKKYALNDAKRTIVLYLGLMEQLKKLPKVLNLYKEEIKLSKYIYNIENRGVRLYPEHLKILRKFYQTYANTWRKKADTLGGKGMNFNSPKQMVQKFVTEKGYKTEKFTNKGNPSINNNELLRLAQKDPLAKAILECKAGENAITKFINAYEKFMVLENKYWVLHPNFKQVGTVTGRFSCSDPNLMQVASEDSVKKRADIGLKPREALGPRENCIWLLPDFSQMEVWVFAFQARDPIMMKALLSGEDFHSITSQQVWGKEADFLENKKHYRKMGKTMMFLKQYGGTAKAGAELMGCSRREAQKAIDNFDLRLPGVNKFINEMSMKINEVGYIENPFGRRYYLTPRFAYKAVNYLVQGTCADIMKRAMYRLSKCFKTKYLGPKILLTLHDELIIEVPKKLDCLNLYKLIITLMQEDSKKAGIPVNLPITMKRADDRWSNAVKIEI